VRVALLLPAARRLDPRRNVRVGEPSRGYGAAGGVMGWVYGGMCTMVTGPTGRGVGGGGYAAGSYEGAGAAVTGGV
jgi:hypothetical protein